MNEAAHQGPGRIDSRDELRYDLDSERHGAQRVRGRNNYLLFWAVTSSRNLLWQMLWNSERVHSLQFSGRN